MEKTTRLKKKPLKVARTELSDLQSFRLVVAYCGTNYFGWQKQAKADGPPTVQEMLENAARKVLRQQKVIIHGSGRTDTGVHARAQVAHLRARVDFPPATLLKAINAHLPEDIRVLQLEPAPPEFHAQLSAKGKTYRYFILHAPGPNPAHWPFLRPYAWFVTYPLDLAAMEKALAALEGRHDFKSFQNRGTPVEDTVRELHEARLIVHPRGPASAEQLPWMPGPEFNGQLLEIRVSGSGFLKQMVRTIAGTVVEVGRGKLKPEAVTAMLAEKNRKASGMTAPAHGLFMDHVRY